MTTVRILGSRAREQVPGTGITLLAPGFRGALTQLAAGVAPGSDHDLPFAEAAAGAEVMLAAQLTLNIEARTAEGLGLRSRSAVAAHPRVIVPRRSGVAYALLQTDETGASSFVLPLAATTDRSGLSSNYCRAGRDSPRIARAHVAGTAGDRHPARWRSPARWERCGARTSLRSTARNGQWLSPDWRALGDGPVLLLLHDTFSTPQAAFADWVGGRLFRAGASARYGGRCLAFTHPTLAAGIDDNVNWLVTHLAQLPGPIDIVAHGSRRTAGARASPPTAGLPLRRVCLVGTPNKGTPLAHDANLLRFLDGHVAMLARIPANVAQATLEGALCMLRFAALDLASAAARHRSVAAAERDAARLGRSLVSGRSSGSR